MKAARDGGIAKPNKATHNLGFKQSGRGEGRRGAARVVTAPWHPAEDS